MWLVFCHICGKNTTPAKPPKHAKFEKLIECSVCMTPIDARNGVFRSLTKVRVPEDKDLLSID